jgi:hypothetical protein
VNEFPDFHKAKHGSATLWVQRSLTSPSMIHLLADADAIFTRPDCVLVKDQRKIKVGRVALPLAMGNTPVYIKRYNCFSLRYRIQTLFFRSGATRALRGAASLQHAQIATATPLAAVEVHRWGMLESSFYIAEEITAAKTADAYWRENLKVLPGPFGFHSRRRFLAELSGLFHKLHGARIYHNDLKDFNILARADRAGGEELFVLDLEGVRHCRSLSARRRVKNLVQLNRTLGRFLTRTEKLRFLKSYLSLSNERAGRPALRAWVKGIMDASAKADRLSLAKRRELQEDAL